MSGPSAPPAPPVPTPHTNLNIAKPLIFHGRLYEDPLAWLDSLETAMDLNGWTDWNHIKNYIKASLRDNALLWYKEQLATGNLVSYAVFRQTFRGEFCTQDHFDAWRDQIETRRQRAGESVEDVLIDIRTLIQRIDSAANPIPEATKVNWILRAIHPETAMKARDRGIKTLAACYKEIPRIEMDYVQYGSGYHQKFVPEGSRYTTTPEDNSRTWNTQVE